MQGQVQEVQRHKGVRVGAGSVKCVRAQGCQKCKEQGCKEYKGTRSEYIVRSARSQELCKGCTGTKV